MTPALTEAVTKGHGVHLPSPFSSRSLDTSAVDCPESDRATEQSRVLQTGCSRLRYPSAEHGLRTDIVNLKHINPSGAQSSARYQTVFLLSTNSALDLQSGMGQPQKLAGRDLCKLKRPFHNGTRLHLSGVNKSRPDTQVKRELFPGTMTNFLADVHGLWDVTVSDSSAASDVQVPKCKLYGRNGWTGKAMTVQPGPKNADVLHCVKPGLRVIPAALKTCSTATKEQEVNSRLLQCLSQQQTLHDRARRTQKRLHALLARNVVNHCTHQMRSFVKHQLQRMQIVHRLPVPQDSRSHKCAEIKSEPNRVEVEDSPAGNPRNGFASLLPGEVWGFTNAAAGLLSKVERNLDSDATGSSSDEDWEEQTAEEFSVGCSPELKWQADRARIGSRWTWLQAQISQLEFRIQRLTDLYKQLRTSKGTVSLEEFPRPKDCLKQRPEPGLILKAARSFQSPPGAPDSSPSHDFEMSPSSPTLLLQNIEKQSAQLTEIVSSLMVPLSASPTSSPRASKSCSHKRLANGIAPSALHNREDVSSSQSRSSDQQHTKKRKRDRASGRSPSVSFTSTSARSRPLHCLHRRKLYRLYTACSLNPQAVSPRDAALPSDQLRSTAVPAPPWSCCDSNRKSWLSEVEPSFHPVLSFPSDLPLRIHLQTCLKNNYEIEGYFPQGPVQGDELKASSPDASEQQSTPVKQWSDGYSSAFKPRAQFEILKQLSEGWKKRHVSETDAGERDRQFEACFPLQEASHGSQLESPTVSNVTMMPRSSHKASAQGILRRRLRSESSYDIDNIVIPMSLIATTKVEKLQYKEILTPRWRVVELQPFERLSTYEDELEDLSDEAFSSRHEEYEEKEKARWSLWVQAKCQRRSSRCSSNNPDGWPGPSLLFRENPASACTLVHCSPEILPPVLSLEMSSYETTWVPHCPEEEQEEKPELLWEPRVFPLSDEEAAALLSPCDTCNGADRPNNSSPGDGCSVHMPGDCCSIKPGSKEEDPRECQSACPAACSSTTTPR